jgi:hypothetical protein
MPETPDRPHRTGLFTIDLIIAICAIIVSGASLWVALRADQTQEALLKSTVWPYVQYDTSDATATGGKRMLFEVRNAGVGPAIVRSIVVSFDGHPYRTLRQLMAACCNVVVHHNMLATTLRDTVIMAHDTVPFIMILPEKVDTASYDRIFANRSNIKVAMCYCSVLGDCWFFDTLHGQLPTEVGKKCPPPQQPQYET